MFKNKLIFVLCAIGISFFMSSKVMAADYASYVQRICGDDRYATAIEVSKNGWANGSEYAVLANGQNFPDALSAAPLAKKYNAPILLNPDSDLDSRVENELQRLGVKQVFIIGGPSVISDTIKNKLERLNIKTTRLWGQNRYETSIKIAEQLNFNGQVVVVNGENFADALSIAPIAAEKSMPVILTLPNTLPESVANYIKNNKITKTYVIGEKDVVSGSIANSFPNSERIWNSNKFYNGSSRYDTNIAVLNKFRNDLNLSNIYLASGENFPDALAGSALAAKNSSAIALVNGSLEALTIYNGDILDIENYDNIVPTLDFLCLSKSFSVLGGTGSINDTIIGSLEISRFEKDNNTTGYADNVTSVVVDGDWLYYYKTYSMSVGDEWDTKESFLCKIKKDLTGYTVLVDTTKYKQGCLPVGIQYNITKIENGWIYYGNESVSFKVRIDGTENTCLSGNPDYS
ncbi:MULTISPECIES: cell wall-binding repeat-containing protein [Clostridium]|uniref:N-acetylmuramoyl-L-alanine amidase LytC n=2 Tax=Clostridium TaxID=1485 RepID=D8GUA0_CLOLD|nr:MULTISPECIES: cell wall-binding repeat-containing protein [Clostridium]ADK14763.1 predicted cell wall binding protein [Clostridium ljungdahlii DSM 13528]AGY78013.1 cell wall-binding repeat-containing protein [Clostridium autoethanogenum DSM 10061]ALU38147.1 Cell wall binding repeat 2-containing protein [Clostridium autoethanogenum DSM 10061]OAA85963.1 N-acetylmuramoyl-L-alanine amidase LytC precursor [Clostridium ljungdahlii DSM 13528]OVY50911.1 N-acetylmuramoyl-L-alanine amidase LytC precu